MIELCIKENPTKGGGNFMQGPPYVVDDLGINYNRKAHKFITIRIHYTVTISLYIMSNRIRHTETTLTSERSKFISGSVCTVSVVTWITDQYSGPRTPR